MRRPRLRPSARRLDLRRAGRRLLGHGARDPVRTRRAPHGPVGPRSLRISPSSRANGATRATCREAAFPDSLHDRSRSRGGRALGTRHASSPCPATRCAACCRKSPRICVRTARVWPGPPRDSSSRRDCCRTKSRGRCSASDVPTAVISRSDVREGSRRGPADGDDRRGDRCRRSRASWRSDCRA